MWWGAWSALYDRLDAAVVEAAVKEACEVFREARVRAFVPILVERRARGALNAEPVHPGVR